MVLAFQVDVITSPGHEAQLPIFFLFIVSISCHLKTSDLWLQKTALSYMVASACPAKDRYYIRCTCVCHILRDLLNSRLDSDFCLFGFRHVLMCVCEYTLGMHISERL